jgi:hypothetical protein
LCIFLDHPSHLYILRQKKALLVRLGALDADHPATRKRLNAVQTNWRGTETGILRLADGCR